jgi:hypothetical protein
VSAMGAVPVEMASRFSLLASRFSLLASRFSLLASRFSLLASRFSLLASRFSCSCSCSCSCEALRCSSVMLGWCLVAGAVGCLRGQVGRVSLTSASTVAGVTEHEHECIALMFGDETDCVPVRWTSKSVEQNALAA